VSESRSGVRRSDATRDRIRRAARTRFAADGYRGATIRAIAADAGIDASLVIRYFGDKQRLFVSVVDVDLRLPELRDVARRRLGAVLVEHFLTRWESEDDALLTLLRSAVTDPVALASMQRLFREQLAPAVAALVDDDREAATRAGLIATQMLGLALVRHVLRLPPVAAASRADLVRQVGPTVQAYLTRPV